MLCILCDYLHNPDITESLGNTNEKVGVDVIDIGELTEVTKTKTRKTLGLSGINLK